MKTMKTFTKTIILLSLWGFAFWGCNTPSSNKNSKQSKIQDSNYSEKDVTENLNTRFVYIKILTIEPTGKEVIKGRMASADIYGTLLPSTPDVELPQYATFVHSSDIITVKDFTEDKKYQLMDEFINSLQLPRITCNYKTIKSEIKERKCLVFNTYAEASDNRFNNMSNFSETIPSKIETIPTQIDTTSAKDIPTLRVTEMRTSYLDKTKHFTEMDREKCNLTVVFNLGVKEIEIIDRATSKIIQWYNVLSENKELSDIKQLEIVFNCTDKNQTPCSVLFAMGGETFGSLTTIYPANEDGCHWFHRYMAISQ